MKIKEITQKYIDDKFEVVYIRFPDDSKDLGKCPLGKVLYIFTNGDSAICPYMVFAARDRCSIYRPEQFLISNVLNVDCDINFDLEHYKLPEENIVDIKCSHKNKCSKGCLAAKVSNGLSIFDCDFELCGKKG